MYGHSLRATFASHAVTAMRSSLMSSNIAGVGLHVVAAPGRAAEHLHAAVVTRAGMAHSALNAL